MCESTVNRIFLSGLTSSSLGGMEWHNLGNYAIIEPLILNLKNTFPHAEIVTSIQMSNAFNEKFNVIPLRQKRFWSYGIKTRFTTAKDVLNIILWKITHKKIFLEKSLLLNEIYRADLYIDFSGDILGDNAATKRYLENCLRILFAKAQGKPVAMFASSPGPFKKRWRRVLAKYIFNRAELITNREPISTELLRKMGVDNQNMHSTACPAFLFQAKPQHDVQPLLENENIIATKDHPLVGMIICGWNMPVAPYKTIPRQEFELIPFTEVIRYLIDTHHVRVLLMSHQNSSDPKGNLIKGNDHAIIQQILEMMKGEYDDDVLFTLKHCYDAATSKTIISHFEMLISGRIHGAVSGLSQAIPTVILDYGHEPKAHKLKGFARVAEVEDFVCDPTSAKDMIEKVDRCWSNRLLIASKLKHRMEKVKKLSLSNFQLLKTMMDKGASNKTKVG